MGFSFGVFIRALGFGFGFGFGFEVFIRAFGFGVWIPFGDHPLKLERYRED